MTKRCTKCNLISPVSFFSKRRRSLDGLDYWCNRCKKEHNSVKQFSPDYNGDKKCGSCGERQAKSNFHKSKRSKDGLEGRCKSCNKQRSDNFSRQRRYGITTKIYSSILASQGGSCAICQRENTGVKRTNCFSVDHCHKTGVVRGLLCNLCNQGLGLFQEKPELLKKAAEYLSSMRSDPT